MIDYDKIKKFLRENRKIEVNNKLIKMLGYEDIRDFTSELYYWGHNTDFTYQSWPTSDWQAYIRAFVKSFLE